MTVNDETLNSGEANDSSEGRSNAQNDDTQNNNQFDANNASPADKPRKMNIPAWVMVFLLAILTLDIICMIRFPKILSDYRDYKTAESRIAGSETSKTLLKLYELTEKHTKSLPIILKTIDLSMQSGYYDTAGYVFDKYLTGKNLSDSWYAIMDRYSTRLSSYYDTYDAIKQIFQTSSGQETPGATREQLEKLNKLLENKSMDAALIYYYLGIFAPDMETARNNMLECYYRDPDCFDVRTQLGIMHRRLGDLNNASYYTMEALRKDKDDYSALRSMAIIKMLNGDLEYGLSYAKDAYNSKPDGTYVKETYLIALTLNNEKEEAMIIKDELIKSEEGLDEDTDKLLKGELTLEDYYIGQ